MAKLDTVASNRPQIRQGLFQVVPEHLNLPVIAKPALVRHAAWLEKRRARPPPRSVAQCAARPVATVTGSQVKNSLDIHRDEFEQDGFTLPAMRGRRPHGDVRASRST